MGIVVGIVVGIVAGTTGTGGATERGSMYRRAGARLAAVAVLLPALLTACRARPTPTPVAPMTPGGAPLDVGGAAGGTVLAAATATRSAPLPSPTPLAPIVPTRPPHSGTVIAPVADASAVPSGTAGTPGTSFPDAVLLVGRRLEGGALGRTYHLDDVRTGEHPGFTRIVWAMDEVAGGPRWTTLLRLDVEGTAVIDVVLSDVTAIAKPETLAAQSPQSPIVDSVQPQRVADDAALHFAIRLSRPTGYRVTVLEDPVRVVVDVAHGP